MTQSNTPPYPPPAATYREKTAKIAAERDGLAKELAAVDEKLRGGA